MFGIHDPVGDVTVSDLKLRIAPVFAGSFIFFWSLYALLTLVVRFDKSVSDRQRADYYSRINANIHAILSTAAAVISLTSTCDEGKLQSLIKNYSVIEFRNIYNSDTCMMQTYAFQQYSLSFSSAYFAYDFLVCLFLIKDTSIAQTLTYAHHLFSFLGSLGSIYVGRQMPQLCVASYITEISTPFMNYRSMMVSEKKGDTVGFKVNNYIFTALFFFFRVLFYPTVMVRIYHSYSLLEVGYPQLKFNIALGLGVVYSLLYGLQLLWFYKIVQSVFKKRKPSTTRKDD